MPRLLQLDPPGFAAALKRLLTVPGPSGGTPNLSEGGVVLACSHPPLRSLSGALVMLITRDGAPQAGGWLPSQSSASGQGIVAAWLGWKRQH